MEDLGEIISKAFANFAGLRDKRMRHYKGLLSVVMMKIRFRRKMARYGQYGSIKGNYCDSLNYGRIRYSILTWGQWVGLPLKTNKPEDWRSVPRKRGYREEYVVNSIYDQRAIA